VLGTAHAQFHPTSPPPPPAAWAGDAPERGGEWGARAARGLLSLLVDKRVSIGAGPVGDDPLFIRPQAGSLCYGVGSSGRKMTVSPGGTCNMRFILCENQGPGGSSP
jgi:hypothetical protein